MLVCCAFLDTTSRMVDSGSCLIALVTSRIMADRNLVHIKDLKIPSNSYILFVPHVQDSSRALIISCR